MMEAIVLSLNKNLTFGFWMTLTQTLSQTMGEGLKTMGEGLGGAVYFNFFATAYLLFLPLPSSVTVSTPLLAFDVIVSVPDFAPELLGANSTDTAHLCPGASGPTHDVPEISNSPLAVTLLITIVASCFLFFGFDSTTRLVLTV